MMGMSQDFGQSRARGVVDKSKNNEFIENNLQQMNAERKNKENAEIRYKQKHNKTQEEFERE